MLISVCGLTVPVIEEVQVSGNAPNGYIEAGNFTPPGSQITADDAVAHGVLCGHTLAPWSADDTIENETYMTSALTGFINGGYIEWGGVVQTSLRFECTDVEYGDDGVVLGTVSGTPSHPIVTTHPYYTTLVNYFMAAIRTIYSDFPNSPSYSIVIAARTIVYNRNGTIRSDQCNWGGNGVRINCAAWKRATGDDEDIVEIPEIPEDPNENDPGGTSGTGGGGGTHDQTDDPIGVPSLPTLGAMNAGFITMYSLNLNEMNTLAGDMFVDSMWEAIKNYFGNPMDFFVGCMQVPFQPPTGSKYKPKYGQLIFGHSYKKIDNQFVEIDCGSLHIDEYWGSCFDFEPFTKIQIWLPFIGYRDLPVDEVMGSTISIKYHCDCLTGDCIAFISRTPVGQVGPQQPTVFCQFNGNCGIRIPYGSVSYDAAVSSAISLVGAAASLGISKGAGNSTVGDTKGLVGATLNAVSSMKPEVSKGGSAGSTSGYMSILIPYIIKRIPRQSLPSDYIKFHGYPSNITATLGSLGQGYAEVDDIQLNNIPAMEDERAEIIEMLKGGVLL